MEQCIKGMKWNDKGIKWNNVYNFFALILLKIKNITTNIPNGIIRFFEKTINNSMFNLKKY